MTTTNSDNLSALVDGELQDERFFESLGSDPELRDTWERYHTIRDGLKAELPPVLDLDLAARVAAAIAQEPNPVDAPPLRDSGKLLQWLPSWLSSGASNDARGRLRGSPVGQQTAQLAIAASVAMAVIFGVQEYQQPSAEQPFTTAPVIPVSGIQGGFAPVSLEQTRALPQSNQSNPKQPNVAQQQRRINAYVNDHKQQMRLKGAAVTTTEAAVTEETDHSEAN